MVVDNNNKNRKNLVEIEAYLKPSWGLASTNILLNFPKWPVSQSRGVFSSLDFRSLSDKNKKVESQTTDHIMANFK
jgi:hypothetical protein